MDDQNQISNPIGDIDVVDFSKYIVDVRRDVKEKTYHFFLNGVGFSPLGNVQAIKAKPKCGKTQFTKILMAAALVGECMGVTCTLPAASVLWIDTEQDPDDAVRVMQGALKLCSNIDTNYKYNEPCDRFTGLSLRTSNTDERRTVVKAAIEHYKPTLVIIDGIRDLVHDFNDLEESAGMIDELMTLSSEYNCAIWSILHENKGDGNMRGHLGTELANKVTDVLQIIKEKDPISGESTFSVEQTEARGKDIEKYTFTVDDYGNPSPTIMSAGESNILLDLMAKSYDHMQKVYNDLNAAGQGAKAGRRKADFIDAICEVSKNKKTYAYEQFNKAIQKGIIIVDVVTKNIHFTGMCSANKTPQPEQNKIDPFAENAEKNTDCPF